MKTKIIEKTRNDKETKTNNIASIQSGYNDNATTIGIKAAINPTEIAIISMGILQNAADAAHRLCCVPLKRGTNRMNPDRPQEQHQYVLSCVSGSTHHCSCGCCCCHRFCSGGAAIANRLLTTAEQNCQFSINSQKA